VSGRTLAIGDIHGCDVALQALLSAVAVHTDDTVVILGDAIDRGPGSQQVLDQIVQLSEKCRVVFLLGNHEEMLLDALVDLRAVEGWLRYGGLATVDSYGGDPQQIPEAHLNLLKSAVKTWETDTELFIHANLEADVALESQSAEWLRWTHLTGLEVPHPSGKRVICGHTPQKSGTPLVVPGWVCIDTFVCGGGWLTCLDVATNEYCQANLVGNLRFGRLESAE
jgi:serine/threonine protein phosphatase 1